MSTGTPFLFTPAKRKLMVGGFNLSADALKVALVTNAQALNAGFVGASGDARYADLTAEVAPGNGYATGGQALTSVTVGYTCIAAAIAQAGTGGTNGAQVVSGTTGTGSKVQANVTVAGGIITAVNSLALRGLYTVLPTSILAEPVSGAGLAGAQLNLTLAATLAAAASSWANSTIQAKYAVVFDNTAPNKDLLLAVDLETTSATGVSTTNGTLSVNWDASGLVYLG